MSKKLEYANYCAFVDDNIYILGDNGNYDGSDYEDIDCTSYDN